MNLTQTLADQNQSAFPHADIGWERHSFVGCRDASAQFLAQDLTVDVFDEPFAMVPNGAVTRALRTRLGNRRTAANDLRRDTKEIYIAHQAYL